MIKQSPKLPPFSIHHRQIPIQTGLVLLLLSWIALSGCSIKQTLRIKVSPNILNAKSATYNELLTIAGKYDEIKSLSSSSLRLTYITGKQESGQLQKYPRAPGYVLLKRPDSTRLAVQNPFSKSVILDLASVGDKFCAWYPRDNKFYTGINSAKELIAEDLPNNPSFTIRATHIFEAILPGDFIPNSPEIHIEMTKEEIGPDASYYTLSTHKVGPSSRIYLLRKIWIERSGLTIARLQVYQEDGKLVSDITYSNELQNSGFSLPLKIHIDRPMDGYTLDMEVRSWSVNPELPDDNFIMTPPASAQIVHFKEK